MFEVTAVKDVINTENAANAIWRTGVCNSYWSAHIIATKLLEEVGDKVVSQNGRFWKRAKEALQGAIIRWSDYRTLLTDAEISCLICANNVEGDNAFDPRTWGENRWANVFEQLRTSFVDVVCGATIPNFRNYWITSGRNAFALGQWMCLHNGSCHWTSHIESFKSLIISDGWMIRGMWTNVQPTIEYKHESRHIGRRCIRTPRITNYLNDNADRQCAPKVVRAWLLPLDNGLLALYNGYICQVGSRRFDFTTRTRHHIVPMNGDVCPLIANDIARYISKETGTEICVKKIAAPGDTDAYINNNKWYLIGDPAHEYMNLSREAVHLDFRKEVKVFDDEWDSVDYGTDEDDVLDYRWDDEDESEYGYHWDRWQSGIRYSDDYPFNNGGQDNG
jgi:hypothetical protein